MATDSLQPSRPPSDKRPVIVGLFVLFGLLFLVAGVLMVGNVRGTFKKNLHVVSLFADVNGLEKGCNIWFSGVKIGTVYGLRFNGRSEVAVTMKIELAHQQYIREDAKVKISTDGLIGNKILVIYGGTTRFNEIQEGDTLAVEKTTSSEDMMNMLQENNQNLLAITTDFKAISSHIAAGEGSVGKLLYDDALYASLNSTAVSLQNASSKAQHVISSLAVFSESLNRQGTLVNRLTTDTAVFRSLEHTVGQLQQIADTARVFMTHLKADGENPASPIGIMLRDEATGVRLKETIANLATSSKKLDENLEAIRHTFLLRRFFGYESEKKKARKAKE